MYIYEGHLGRLFVSDYPLSFEECYCEQCGDYDWEIGSFNNPQEFLRYYADSVAIDGNGGYALEDVFEWVLDYFDEEIDEEEAIKIVRDAIASLPDEVF